MVNGVRCHDRFQGGQGEARQGGGAVCRALGLVVGVECVDAHGAVRSRVVLPKHTRLLALGMDTLYVYVDTVSAA